MEVNYQSHSMECPAYDDLRVGLDQNLVAFFKMVMGRRSEKV